MNFTKLELDKWKNQLRERCTKNFSLNISYEEVEGKFQQQIANGCHVNLIKTPEKFIGKKFIKEHSEDFKMAKRRYRKAANRNKNKARASCTKKLKNDNAAIKEELSRAGAELEKSIHGNSSTCDTSWPNSSNGSKTIDSSIISSTPKAISDETSPPSKNLRCGNSRRNAVKYESLQGEHEASTSFDSDKKTKKSKTEDSSQDDFTWEDNLTLQQLLQKMTEEKKSCEYHRDGKPFIKFEENSPGQGDVVVIKLPYCNNRKATVDLTGSKEISDMMFFPVLAEEKELFKNRRASAPSSSNYDEYSAMAPFQFNKTSCSSLLNAHGLLQESFRSMQSFAVPCFLIPASSFFESSQNTPSNDKNSSSQTNRSKNKKGSRTEETTNNTSQESLTRRIPVRVTAQNGFDITHYVDVPWKSDWQSSDTKGLKPRLALEPNEKNSVHLQKADDRKSSVKRQKKRKESMKNVNKIKENPKKNHSKVQSVPKNPFLTSLITSVHPPEKDASFLAGLDMPSINEEARSQEAVGCKISTEQTPTQTLLSTNSSTTLLSQTASPSSDSLVNQNLSSSNHNAEIMPTVVKHSTVNDFDGNEPNDELLERFFFEEVGEIFLNEMDADENISKTTFNPPIGSIVSMDLFDKDFLSLDNNVIVLSAAKPDDSAYNSLSNSQVNSVDLNNSQTNQTNLTNFNCSDEQFIQNLCNSNFIPKESYTNENCFAKPQQLNNINEKNMMDTGKVIFANNMAVPPKISKERVDHDQEHNNAYLNICNVIEDHSYSINKNFVQIRTFKAKVQKDPIQSDKKLISDCLVKNIRLQEHDSFLNDSSSWTQSQQMGSPLIEFVEQQEDMILDTPPHSSGEERTSSCCPEDFLQNKDNKENNPEKQVLEKTNMEDKLLSETPDDATKNKDKPADKSSFFASHLKEQSNPLLQSDSSGLDYDLLNFECESFDSLDISNDSSKNNQNGMTENSIDKNKNSAEPIKEVTTWKQTKEYYCSSPSYATESFTSCLINKNKDIRELHKTKKLTTANNGRKSPNQRSPIVGLNKTNEKRDVPLRSSKKFEGENSPNLKTAVNDNFSTNLPRIQKILDTKTISTSENRQSPNKSIFEPISLNEYTFDNVLSILKQDDSLTSVPQLNQSEDLTTEQLNPSTSPAIQHKSDNSLSMLTIEDIENFFNLKCYPSLIQNCLCPKSHDLREAEILRLELMRLKAEDVDILYKFALRYKKLYFLYFNEFCHYYAEIQSVDRLCKLFRDCQLYKNFPATKFWKTYDGFIKCGLTKQKACNYILTNIRCWTSEISKQLFLIIVESDWTLFLDYVPNFLDDESFVFNQITLGKMVQSFLKNPTDDLLKLLCKFIFKLQVQNFKGNPLLQKILKMYNLCK